ncbi:MAG: class I SAM-dependent methyltransferase [Flammeovirgaceae bacterium]|nr:class I SAM-dependent methyltransferase [Flammeovirgaceae bacterium]
MQLDEKTRIFIEENQNSNPFELLLQRHRYPEIDVSFAVRQIEGRRKAKEKLPSWYALKNIFYPEKLALEQSSSEKTALYKAQLVSGRTLADLTGGFGVDTWAFSQRFATVFYVEQNEDLVRIAQHNFQMLKADNIHTIVGDSLAWLKQPMDAVYLDPARRNPLKKAIALEDCQPNVLKIIPSLFKHTNTILLKTSPLLDIQHALRQLPSVAEIHVVSIENECKEVLFLLKKQQYQSISIHAVHFPKNHCSHHFVFTLEEEKNAHCSFTMPQKYLYEPNASLLKAGAFKVIAERFDVCKLHVNSHLYTSEKLLPDFQGRIFEIEEVISFHKKTIEKELKLLQKANIAVRNFPMSVEQIRKLTKLEDGGEVYLFATTDFKNNKILVKCRKVV